MANSFDDSASPYAPPAVHSFAEEVPPGMELVAEDRDLAACVKIRTQTPRSCLTCLAAVAFWMFFVSALFGGCAVSIPPPDELAAPLWTTIGALAAGALTAVLFVVAAAQRPQRRFAISARGVVLLSTALAVGSAIWVTAAILSEGVWRDSIGILLWTVPIWVFLTLGMLAVWCGRYAWRRLTEAGISENAIALEGRKVYDYRP